jgi:TRAP-type C4-dicarboxylate transport system permease small subunit
MLMKISAMAWIGITTSLLVLLAMGAALNLRFSWIFFGTLIGQALILVMVYKVLKDNYTTDKTFEDFYEDRPVPRENYR